MKVFLVPNRTKDKSLEVALQAADILAKNGAHLLIDEQYTPDIDGHSYIKPVKERSGYEQCDVVISIGGDGSMLHAARHILRCQKPLMGINTGRLGFLTALEYNELTKLHLLTKGEYTVEHRGLIRYDYPAKKDFGLALNDIVLFKASAEKTIALDIYCDDIFISSFRGDGIVFSTSTGSTAYSMSAGGPIVDARLAGIIVTQICAHIVPTPPLVLAQDRVVKVVCRSTEEEKSAIVMDGVEQKEFATGDTLQISLSDQTVPLVQFHDTSQLKSVDKKLKGR